MPNKVVLVGRAGVGKTTIKEVVFEGIDAHDLIIYPLEPTRGIVPSVYSWMDIQLGLFDTSGQELLYLLEDEDTRLLVFEDADIIVYIFDYASWAYDSQEIIDEIKKIYQIIEKHRINSKIYIILHKIDLISQKLKDPIISISNQIKLHLDESQCFKLFLTSIHPDSIFTIFNTFSEILSSFSKETMLLKSIADDLLKGFSKTFCLITNNQHNIIAQSFTNDIDINLIHPIYKKIDLLSKTTKNKMLNESGLYIIENYVKILSISMEMIDKINSNLRKLILISETLGKEKLLELNDVFIMNLEKLYREKREVPGC